LRGGGGTVGNWRGDPWLQKKKLKDGDGISPHSHDKKRKRNLFGRGPKGQFLGHQKKEKRKGEETGTIYIEKKEHA